MIVRNEQSGHIEYVRSSPIDCIPLGYMNDPVKFILRGYKKTFVPDVMDELGIDRIQL